MAAVRTHVSRDAGIAWPRSAIHGGPRAAAPEGAPRHAWPWPGPAGASGAGHLVEERCPLLGRGARGYLRGLDPVGEHRGGHVHAPGAVVLHVPLDELGHLVARVALLGHPQHALHLRGRHAAGLLRDGCKALCEVHAGEGDHCRVEELVLALEHGGHVGPELRRADLLDGKGGLVHDRGLRVPGLHHVVEDKLGGRARFTDLSVHRGEEALGGR
eukprot:CAMPEP_0206011974 /NCGR_PEP_ID=MMETSP1464-20131121/14115_1 /ASSEMBLY_ACC=CAM_ASM_001124 /TAXON_ID=119497 /ORGANISM="Exanthemachrysis gayraliae, Strain RCC1523" /LENGTH=214 /DNA_ID=CAMNT_0053385653 /DNA_START=289 /DNA_END=929 /DNA_ORIENTATION=-